MSNRRIGLALAVLGGAALVAAPKYHPWQDKDFSQWTDKDARMIMTNSPWAKQVPLPSNSRPSEMVIEPGDNGAPPPSASLGNPSNSTSGTNMTVAANPGSAGPADPHGTHSLPTTQTPSGATHSTAAPETQPAVTIIWASAIPVRLAVLKMHSGNNAPDPKAVNRAMQPRDNYVIAVVGLPPPAAGSDGSALASNATITPRGKAAIPASKSNYRKIGREDVYFFHFPKAEDLTTADQRVEFRLKTGGMQIKKSFDLQTMEYKGQLTL